MSEKLMEMRYGISDFSINRAIFQIRFAINIAYKAQDSYLSDRYRMIHKRTSAWTMRATGETASRLFKKNKNWTPYVNFSSVGYNPTTNNQSVSQEFDIHDIVHTRKKQHYRSDGKTPKCSVNPNDIYTARGKRYGVNRNARRRALALSVEKALNTTVTHGYKYGEGKV